MNDARPSSDEHLILKAPFAESLGRKKILNNDFGNTRSFSKDHHDFKLIKLCGGLEAKKESPSVNSHVGDEVTESCMDVIVSCCSTTACQLRCHYFLLFSIVIVTTDIPEK